MSLFIAPDRAQIEASHALGVEQIELHTGEYAHAAGDAAGEQRELERLADGARSRGASSGSRSPRGTGSRATTWRRSCASRRSSSSTSATPSIADAVFVGAAVGAVRAMLAAIAQGARDAMIVGLGIDVCSIERMRRALERHGDRFFSRICSEAERARSRPGATCATALAGRFAVKEAFAKALDGAPGVGWHEVEVRRARERTPDARAQGQRARDGRERSARTRGTSASRTMRASPSRS